MAKLSPQDAAICGRLREARERILGLSQPEVAKQLGITRELLLSYEYKRAPVRHELAVRFCRRFIISEEWLATGKHVALEEEAIRLGRFGEGPRFPAFEQYFERQCMDLLSEEVFHDVPPRTTFALAWSEHYAASYRRLVNSFFSLPRLVLRDSDDPKFLSNMFTFYFDRWLDLLSNEALGYGREPGLARRSFLRVTFEMNMLLWRRYMGLETPDISQTAYDFLRVIAKDAVTPIGPLADAILAKRAIPQSMALPKLQKDVTLDAMTTTDGDALLRTLRQQLKDATSRRGMKAQLARTFGVTQPTVTEWINGPAKPSAENTLALLEWVKRAEANAEKEPGRAQTRPSRATRKSKSTTHEKAKSSHTKR